MKKVNTETLKKTQLDILSEVDRFCRERKIHYWLDYGTLLGAIRHKGYIPWDDDIDIGMLRKDFDMFLLEFNRSSTRYRVISNELSSDCYYPYAKVVDTKTILYEPDEQGLKLGINIDVFVYDTTPGGRITNRQYQRHDRLAFLNVVQYKHYRSNKWYKRVPKDILHCALMTWPRGYFAAKIVQNARRYEDVSTNLIGNLAEGSRIVCNRNVVSDCILREFEGREYPVPAEYDMWLTLIYGDYMKLPPVEEQICHHKFIAYITDE